MNFFNRFKLLCLFLVVAIFFSAGVVVAQDNSNVRIDDKEGYTRVVFEWPSRTDYNIEKKQDQVIFSFDREADIDPSAVNKESFRNVSAVSVKGDNITVNIAEGSTIRNFRIGNKIILDVYDGTGVAKKVTAKAEEEVKEPTEKLDDVQSKKVDKPVEKEIASSSSLMERIRKFRGDDIEEQSVSSGADDGDNKEKKIPTTPRSISGDQPHVIIISSTEAVGIAAFERADHIWLVFNRPLKSPPVFSGPDKDRFNNIQAIDLENGVAYRFKKPENYYFYGEGGGLLWRFVMTPNPRDEKSLQPVITDKRNLSWPINNIAKEIEITDPMIGDTITVATVTDSSSFTIDRRDYVDLTVFPSYIGLAYAPISDNITGQKTATDYVIARDGGLAISPQSDTASLVIKDDIEKEVAAFDAEDNPDNIRRIYDFERWKMGGVRSLEKNRQILMNDLVNKQGARKAEDLITLAKLNIANDRGQEALGLLRVAALELPGINENPEFISLNGAAASLAARYDIAVENLFLPALQDYEEINYWKAFALAGLEDWRQADKVMPSDLRPIDRYPQQVKEPMALALAETALRAGNNDRAEELLRMLESEFAEMSTARQSAWKYLNGELERQNGNFDQALANWKPLLDGRDDYYRAKAGLSVTKMELDRNKVSAEKAIDRLEGLRYAWRGDELESLINLRLGEVYIENGDYLKGLSVLRNAVSISPNAAITEDITDYMTASFRRLFTDGSLDKISPIEAVGIYEEFKELTPIGKEGDLFVRNLAERLVDVDLLERAVDILQYQVTHRLEGGEKSQVAIRLAAIQLLDAKPDAALQSLDIAQTALNSSGEKDEFKTREIKLLRARALSKTNQSTQALSILNNMREDEDVLKLKTDIAWTSGEWQTAANAFKKLMDLENISLTAPPEEYTANLILNRAIALNLASNRSALNTLRDQYQDLMMQSDKARIFDLVTRPRKLGILDNQQSVSSLISEVDLFGDFLDNYRSINN